MTLAPDIVLHLKLGALMAVFFGLMFYLQPLLGTGMTIALASALAGIATEWYQKHRKEGTASWGDAVASAAPGVAAGLIYQFYFLGV